MIEELTPRQEAMIPKYVAAWVNDLTKNKATPEQLTEAVQATYRLAGIDATPEVVVTDSPKASIDYAKSKGVTQASDLAPYVLIWWRVNIAYWRFAKYIGVELDEDIKQLAFLCRHADTILAYDELAVISRKPVEVNHRDNRLHCDGGPAIRYADGHELYALNGVRVSRKLAVTPAADLDPEMLLHETNAEVRREIVAKIGIERIATELGARTLDAQGDYEVVVLDSIVTEREDKPTYLKMKNPSIGVWHLEGVPPEIRTVNEAIAWRNGTKLKPRQLT